VAEKNKGRKKGTITRCGDKKKDAEITPTIKRVLKREGGTGLFEAAKKKKRKGERQEETVEGAKGPGQSGGAAGKFGKGRGGSMRASLKTRE